MDSLDFLDIMFSLEKAFGTKIRDEDSDRFLRPLKSSDAPLTEYLTADEMRELAQIIPLLIQAAAEGPVARNRVFSFITLDAITRIVQRKLEASA